MHIPVDYHDAVDAVALKSRLCCDSTVVEEAEPHRTLLLGVVSRRPDQGKGILDAGIDNVHGRLDRAPRGHFRRLGCSVGIVDVRGSLPVVLVQVHAPFSEGGAVKLAPPWRYWHLHGLVRLLGHFPVHHGFDVLLGVHFSKLSGGREPGRDEPAAPHDPSRPQPLEGSPDPIRVLHVPLAGAGGLVHVIQHAVVMNDPRGLAVLALRVPPPLLPAAALADVLVGGHVAILLLCAGRKEAHALVMKPLVAGVAREHRPGLVVGLLAHAVDLLLVPLVHQPLGVAPDQQMHILVLVHHVRAGLCEEHHGRHLQAFAVHLLLVLFHGLRAGEALRDLRVHVLLLHHVLLLLILLLLDGSRANSKTPLVA
mmetsp:Transcript_5138/g.9177  ORF Transcript_5138/g.9177 Transcript_5138/m.9177 type:complete len:367 (+) Transcript_5138:1793-2893(+)